MITLIAPTVIPNFVPDRKYEEAWLLRDSAPSLADVAASMPEDEYNAYVEAISGADPTVLEALAHDWSFWGRPAQWEPTSCERQFCGCANKWTHWLVCAGRGWGKTRTGAATVANWADLHPGCRIALIGATSNDVRKVMIQGDSGILATARPDFKPLYNPSLMQLTYPCPCHRGSAVQFNCPDGRNSLAFPFSADEPERFRGPQHHFYWADEIASWKRVDDCWSNLNMGLRLTSAGRMGWPKNFRPRGLITTTPKGTKFMFSLTKKSNVHITRGSTDDNKSNLAEEFFTSVISEFRGSRLGQQELEGALLEDVPGALFKEGMLEKSRVKLEDVANTPMTCVIAIDPATSSKEGSDATGIVVVACGPPPGEEGDYDDGTSAIDANSRDQMKRAMKRLARTHGYVVADESGVLSPQAWAKRAIELYYKHRATCIVAEANQGGDMVRDTLRSVDDTVPIKLVHATKNKQTRAEPIVALFEQGRAHLVGGHPELERELTTWDPEISRKSPDRLDAMVWGLHHLLVRTRPRPTVHPQPVNERPNPWAIFSRN